MNKLTKWISAVVVVVGALVLSSAAAAFAASDQQAATPPAPGAGYGMQAGRGGMGGARMGGGMNGQTAGTPALSGAEGGYLAQYDDLMHAEIAKALGLSVSDFEAAIASGQTMYTLATEKGVDFAKVQAAMQTGQAAALKQAVADGTLTQVQADAMSSRMGGQMRGGAGRMNGQGFRDTNCTGTCPLVTPAAPSK